MFFFSARCSSSGCDALDKKAATEYEEATRRWNAGDYQAAVSMYIELAKNHPFSPYADNALYWVGVTQFLYLGQTERALQTLGLALKILRTATWRRPQFSM